MSNSDFTFAPTPAPAKGIKEVRVGKPIPQPTPAPNPTPTPTASAPAEAKPTTAPEKPKYSKEQLAAVFDEMIFKGQYSEDVILRGKIRVTFRTRSTEEVNQIQREIDAGGFNLVSSVEMFRTTRNLECSLISYHGKDLSSWGLDDKHKFIANLPGPVTGMLVNAMMEFDQKVGAAMQDGEANF